MTTTTVEADAVTNQSSRGAGEKNYDKLQNSVNVQEENREIDLSILSQKGAPTYLDFKTKDEYKTLTSPENPTLKTKLPPAEKKFSLRSLFRKDFNQKQYLLYRYVLYFSFSIKYVENPPLVSLHLRIINLQNLDQTFGKNFPSANLKI